jgi:hypothetical protein
MPEPSWVGSGCFRAPSPAVRWPMPRSDRDGPSAARNCRIVDELA